MHNKTLEKLLQKYLDVCNKAIEENKNEFPYKQAMSSFERMFENNNIHIAIYDDRVKDMYVLKYKNSKLSNETSEEPVLEKSWHINYSHLKHVVDNPEQYIKHPIKLDWEWVKNRTTGR